jgi:hypothetical protein
MISASTKSSPNSWAQPLGPAQLVERIHQMAR